jgi:hypothetical protein
MVAVMVDRPLGEHHVGVLAAEDARETVVMRGIDDGAAVDLVRENSARLQASAGALGFGGADGRAAV